MNTLDIRDRRFLQLEYEFDTKDFSCNLIIDEKVKLILTCEQLFDLKKQISNLKIG